MDPSAEYEQSNSEHLTNANSQQSESLGEENELEVHGGCKNPGEGCTDCKHESQNSQNDEGNVTVKCGQTPEQTNAEAYGSHGNVHDAHDEQNTLPTDQERDDLVPSQEFINDDDFNAAEATSDIGDEYEESEESNELEPFIASVYSCPACGWKPHMEKCPVHRAFQTGFSNGVYQYQGIMPSQAQGYQNYNYFHGYAAGQRPMYPVPPVNQPTAHAAVDMRYNPTTNQVSAVPVPNNNQVRVYFNICNKINLVNKN